MDLLNAAVVRSIGAACSNWGRWGDDDQRGTLNLLTPEVVRAACALPATGEVISMAIDFDARGPAPEGAARHNARHVMRCTGNEAEMVMPGGFRFADDDVSMSVHAATHWDALSHVHYDGQLYNGLPSSSITDDGATSCGIEQLRDGIVGRGVLLDIARHRGVAWIDDGEAVGPEELEACAYDERVDLRSGDVILVRTGRIGRARREGDWGETFAYGPMPGLSVRCAQWLREHDVAAVATDTVAVEVLPGEVDDCAMPLHMICLRDVGMTFGELFDVEALAAACDRGGRHEFLFAAPPLPITGAVGSPINPIAVL